MTQVATFHLFYPMLFLTIVILGIIIALVIAKCKDGKLFQNIFYKSTDNAKEITLDTTSKMKSMHDNVVKVDFTASHEKELHLLEQNVKELNIKVDLLMEKVITIERKLRQ